MSLLRRFGWSPELLSFPIPESEPDSAATPPRALPEPARVVFQSGEVVRVVTERGERLALPSGRLLATDGPPVVGDWLLVHPLPGDDSVVAARILPRRGVLARLAVGGPARRQLVATHVDALLVLVSAAAFPNARRIERGVAWAAACGIPSVVGLAKIDLADDRARVIDEAIGAAGGAPVHPFSSRTGEGVEPLLALLPPGATVALAGPSGVGKSTLANRLTGGGEESTGEVRESDGRGRHTTTWKRLLPLPSGLLLVDTPGFRELALWEPGEGLDAAFPEIDAASARCRFRDCRHEGEPGCVVRSEIDAGRIDPARLESRRKLEREALALERRLDPRAAREEKARWKKISKQIREIERSRR